MSTDLAIPSSSSRQQQQRGKASGDRLKQQDDGQTNDGSISSATGSFSSSFGSLNSSMSDLTMFTSDFQSSSCGGSNNSDSISSIRSQEQHHHHMQQQHQTSSTKQEDLRCCSSSVASPDSVADFVPDRFSSSSSRHQPSCIESPRKPSRFIDVGDDGSTSSMSSSCCSNDEDSMPLVPRRNLSTVCGGGDSSPPKAKKLDMISQKLCLDIDRNAGVRIIKEAITKEIKPPPQSRSSFANIVQQKKHARSARTRTNLAAVKESIQNSKKPRNNGVIQLKTQKKKKSQQSSSSRETTQFPTVLPPPLITDSSNSSHSRMDEVTSSPSSDSLMKIPTRKSSVFESDYSYDDCGSENHDCDTAKSRNKQATTNNSVSCSAFIGVVAPDESASSSLNIPLQHISSSIREDEKRLVSSPTRPIMTKKGTTISFSKDGNNDDELCREMTLLSLVKLGSPTKKQPIVNSSPSPIQSPPTTDTSGASHSKMLFRISSPRPHQLMRGEGTFKNSSELCRRPSINDDTNVPIHRLPRSRQKMIQKQRLDARTARRSFVYDSLAIILEHDADHSDSSGSSVGSDEADLLTSTLPTFLC